LTIILDDVIILILILLYGNCYGCLFCLVEANGFSIGSKVQDGLTFVWRNSKKVRGIVLEGGSWRERDYLYEFSARGPGLIWRGA